jgi:hypothetical protein
MPPHAAQSSASRPPIAAGRAGDPVNPYASDGRRGPAPVSNPIPPGPPPEVLDAMGAAADAYDRLKTAGRRLHFETDPVTGRLTVQVLDPDGNVITTLPPSKVLDLASGGSLD